MSAQHTPGPWYSSRQSPDAIQGLVISEASGVNVAVTYNPKDARLIAAAPELLAALERARDHLIMSGTKCTDAPEALAQARAAIAAAKGTS